MREPGADAAHGLEFRDPESEHPAQPVLAAGPGLVVLPLSLAGMVLGAVSWLAPAGGALLAAAGQVCSWSVGALDTAARAGLIGESVPLRPGLSLALGYYALLMCAAVFMHGGKVRRGALALPGLAAFPALIREWPLAHKGLSVAALDTGQSQALALEFPDGSRALIDGGGTWSTSDFDIRPGRDRARAGGGQPSGSGINSMGNPPALPGTNGV